MKHLFSCSLVVLLFFSCAKIPVQSVALADALQVEGERMHKLNLLLLNRIFMAKQNELQKFMKEEYMPTVIKEMMGGLNEEAFKAQLKEKLPSFTAAAMNVVNRRRDSLMTALQLQQEKLVDKLNTDYKVFDNGAFELRKLLESSVKVDKERQALFDRAKTLSNNRIDFDSVETALDKFIHSAGNVGSSVSDLNTTIERLLNNK